MTVHVDRTLFETLYGETEIGEVAGSGGWNAPGGVRIDEDRLQAAFDQANSRVDGYVRGRHPAGTTTPALKEAAAAIARHQLRSRTDASTLSKEVQARFEEAMRFLRDVQAGRAALIAADGTVIGEADDFAGSFGVSENLRTNNGRTAKTLRGWIS